MPLLLEEPTEWQLLRLPHTLCKKSLPGFFHNLYYRVKAIGVMLISTLARGILSR
jgi:hypothetical protein